MIIFKNSNPDRAKLSLLSVIESAVKIIIIIIIVIIIIIIITKPIFGEYTSSFAPKWHCLTFRTVSIFCTYRLSNNVSYNTLE